MKNRLEELFPSFDFALAREIRALGIDLGTTNSTAAEVVLKPGAAPVCRTIDLEQTTREGVYTSPLVPSVVAILPDGAVWVGEGAKRLRAFPQEYGLSFEKNLFYDTKNEMGLRKTYHRAPADFNHASKIGGHVLRFLAASSEKIIGAAPDTVSVTVPASFQLNQRRDTLLAARSAGLQIADDDLLDEPTAALTDYILTNGADAVIAPNRRRPSLCVVFDFGGGTCDVSVIEISRDAESGGLGLSQLSISRYHRLGGGDIDAAIVHEVLIPGLLAENNLTPLDLTWAQKKKGLEPQLLGKAEALKIALCREVERLLKFDKYTDAEKPNIVARQPSLACVLGDRTLRLSHPSLSAPDFEKLLTPFLDSDFLYARETEFRLTQSIFAPLEDALSRARKSAEDVDFCLLVGGSTLIPQVREAVRGFFPNSRLGLFESHLDAQLAVVRGAAWNAAIKAATGRPLIQPVLHDGIALVTSEGKLDILIPSGTSLPFPPDGSYLSEKLMVPRPHPSPPVPQSADYPRELRFEVVGQEDRQHIFDAIWTLPEGISPGDEIVMEYRFTAGKQFECRASFPKRPSRPLEQTVENPLVNVANPNAVQVRIEEAEEKLRRREIEGAPAERDAFFQLAKWYAELNQREKALDYLRTAQTRVRIPDPEILNLQGIYLMELGDFERGKKAFLDAAQAEPAWGGPLFNLALNFRRSGFHEEALKTIDWAIQSAGMQGSFLGLKSLCLESLGRGDEARTAAVTALKSFPPPRALEDWDLGWYRTIARLLGDERAEKAAAQEFANRKKKPDDMREGVPRPALWGDKETHKPS